MDVGERIADVPYVAKYIDELVEERLNVDVPVPHAVVEVQAKHCKGNEDCDRRASVESGEPAEGRGRQRVEQVRLILLVHAQQQAVAQSVPGNNEE